MSLRARLVATLLVLATLGLVVLGGVTYARQRSFLTERVDDQTRSAAFAVAGQLGGRPPRFGRGGPQPGGPGGRPADSDEFDLPPGTYGELRDASGERLRSYRPATYTGTLALPRIPAHPARRVVDHGGCAGG